MAVSRENMWSAPGLMRLLHRLAACGLLLIAGTFALPATARPLEKPKPLLRACIVAQPELAPLIPDPPEAAAADDDDDSDDDDDEDEEDVAEDTLRGFLHPDGVTCVAVGGSVNAGVQYDSRMGNGARKVTGLRQYDVMSFPYTGIMKIDTITPTGDGWSIGTGFTFAVRSGSDQVVDRAVVSAGALSGGYDSSTFNFWDGSSFASTGRLPARQANMFAWRLQITSALSAGLSVETPVPAPTSSTDATTVSLPTAGVRYPDLVGRLLYEGDSLTWQAAAAVRERRQLSGEPQSAGIAGMFGVTKDIAAGDVTHSFTAQVAAARGASAYIGSQLDTATVRGLLTGGEPTRGWNGILSMSSAWTDRWSTNAYISRYDLRISGRDSSGGRIEINRVAANIVWKPAQQAKIGFELGLSRVAIDLPSRVISADLSGKKLTAQIWFERTF